ncbi:MAG: Hsp20/alpha crystallin family protein [Lautropia sp.]
MASISIYDPFADVFPELFRGFAPATAGNGERKAAAAAMRVDVREGKDSYTVKADLPGVKKDDIHVEIDGNQVMLRAEVRKESEQREGERVLRAERYVGQFARSFSLASEIDEDKSVAKFEDGVLELTLQKKATSAARRLSIA